LASLAFSADGGLLAVGAGNGMTEIWNVATQALITKLGEPNAPAQQLVNSLTFSADGTLLAIAEAPERVTIWGIP
jgi:WD40 repeat protein